MGWLTLGSKGQSGFSASSTAEDVTQGIDGSGRTAVITGASSGIGTETARVLALRGVHVILGVRNVSAGNNVKEIILKEIPTAKVDVLELDLNSMASVRKFAADFNSLNLPLNILINNAGVAMSSFMLSQDGIEMNFATNHIGHFLLTNLLLENMKATASKSGLEGRIVIVSSAAYRISYREGIRFDKINEKSGYNGFAAYGQSKLANIFHAQELSDRLKGAATSCYVALHTQLKGVSGKYFEDCNSAKLNTIATDREMAKKLWDFSVDIINGCNYDTLNRCENS